MNTKKKIAFLSILMVSTIGFSIEGTAQTNDSLEISTIEENQKIDKIKDFKEDRDKAKEWADKEFEKWNKELKKDQVEAFKEVKSISTEQQDFGIQLEGYPVEEKARKEEMLKKIESINKALDSKTAKLNENLKVYQNVTLEEIDRTLSSKDLLGPDGKINQERFDELKGSLTTMRYEGLKVTDIAYTPDKYRNFKLEISVSKGERVGYSSENQLVLEQDKALEVTKVSKIVEKGKEKIKIEAKLVDKEKIEEKITEENNKVNEELNKKMGYEANTKMIEYRFTGSKSEFLLEEAKATLSELENRFNEKESLKKILNYIKAKNGKIYFVDRRIYSYPEAYLQGLIDGNVQEQNWDKKVLGLTNGRSTSILIDMMRAKNPELRSDTLVHEIGHLSDILASQMEGSKVLLSRSKEFLDIFNKEGGNLTEYGKTQSSEFFAEAFRLYHSNKKSDYETLKNNAPEAYKYMEKIEEIIKNGAINFNIQSEENFSNELFLDKK